MSYTDTDNIIQEFITIASDALENIDRVMSLFSTFYIVKNIPPPTTDTVLINEIAKDLTPPVAPVIDSTTKVPLPNIYKIVNGGSFSKVLDNPPIFQGDTTFNFSESQVSWLMGDIYNAIQNLFNKTGFEDIEQEIWDKGVERRIQKLRDDKEKVIAGYAMQIPMVTGRMDRDIEVLDRQYDDEKSNSNNEITLQMLDIAQKNAQFGINSGLDGEAMLVSYFSRIASRSLSAAKAVAGIALEVFGAELNALNAEIRANRERMTGAVEVEQAQIQGYMDSLEAVRAELASFVDNLSSQISIYRSLLQGYKANVSAERSEANVALSWTRSQYRQNIAGIKARFETAMAGISSGLSATGLNTEVMASKLSYYVHYLAAAMSALQTQTQEEFLMKNMGT